MPLQLATTITCPKPKIRRRHTGCKACKKRGKRCDESKPYCRACVRLKLDCSYAVEYSFLHHDARSLRSQGKAKKASPVSSETSDQQIPEKLMVKKPCSPILLDCGSNLEATYWNHFEEHVRRILPGVSDLFMDTGMLSPSLRFAALCISASNLSMLNAQVQRRSIKQDIRRSFSSPLVNKLHHTEAKKYHTQALTHSSSRMQSADPCADLAALVLLAYYHHASTDHLKFRLAVWESVQFVLLNKDSLLRTAEGIAALQMWHRLCISHRLSKPPAFMLEGEGPSAFGPNRFPDTFDQLFLSCILNMTTDDLIYDILIKSIEIRSRWALFRSVARSRQISEHANELGCIAYETLNRLLGRPATDFEQAEAEQGFVRGSNLVGLLQVQKQRLQVWKSRLADGQLPRDFQSDTNFPTHRDAMNAIYYLLCQMTFEETDKVTHSNDMQASDQSSNTALASLADRMCQVAGSLDFTNSATEDIYTFSLAETLIQLVLVSRSETLFNYILDVLWPQMERRSRGYEHSHYPTHLAKRIIAEIARYWDCGKAITYAQPAVPENIPKLKLLDINYPLDVVVCGYDEHGGHFIERISLP
ncbi:hypothetical protein BJY01DRAFT_7331 [Aspergillus pseudoustus]|uniref:Zn(2)-C6 fungal-type domain-containing protein n=1 Tax=Aspergillus pseudoustus TaxID=1810923 RepID=A0ABR4JNX8_9EURO